jgi:hypothetical protein
VHWSQLVTFYAIFDAKPGQADLPVAVGDRFSWLAFWLPPVFAMRHGLWLELAGYVLLVLALGFASLWVGQGATTALYGVLAASIGFAAPALRRAKLTRAGWTYRRELWAPYSEQAQLEALQ